MAHHLCPNTWGTHIIIVSDVSSVRHNYHNHVSLIGGATSPKKLTSIKHPLLLAKSWPPWMGGGPGEKRCGTMKTQGWYHHWTCANQWQYATWSTNRAMYHNTLLFSARVTDKVLRSQELDVAVCRGTRTLSHGSGSRNRTQGPIPPILMPRVAQSVGWCHGKFGYLESFFGRGTAISIVTLTWYSHRLFRGIGFSLARTTIIANDTSTVWGNSSVPVEAMRQLSPPDPPLHPPPPPTSTPTQDHKHVLDKTQIKILVVDDSHMNRNIMAACLRRSGYRNYMVANTWKTSSRYARRGKVPYYSEWCGNAHSR